MAYWTIIRDERGLFHKYKPKKFKSEKDIEKFHQKFHEKGLHVWTSPQPTKRKAYAEMEKRYDKPKGYFAEKYYKKTP
jgi:hypothetical protein